METNTENTKTKTKVKKWYWSQQGNKGRRLLDYVCTTVQSDQVNSNQIIFINQLSFVLVIKVLSADSRWEYLWIHYPLGSSHCSYPNKSLKSSVVFKRCILFIHSSKVGSLRKSCSIVAMITLYSWNFSVSKYMNKLHVFQSYIFSWRLNVDLEGFKGISTISALLSSLVLKQRPVLSSDASRQA